MTARRILPAVFAALVLACGALIAPASAADVIMSPSDGCNQVRELGKVRILTEYIAREGQTCFDTPFRRLKVEAMAVEWAPPDLPLFVFVKRSRAGYRLHMTSMLKDRRYRHVCWSHQPVAVSDARSPAATWRFVARAFDRWAADCSTMRTVGLAAVRRSFSSHRYDFERGFARLAQERGARFGPPEDEVGVGSFLPTRISQALLDAVADACGGPRERLKLLADGSIAWSWDDSLPYGTDGSRPFDYCVHDQIKYFPGYPKRN